MAVLVEWQLAASYEVAIHSAVKAVLCGERTSQQLLQLALLYNAVEWHAELFCENAIAHRTTALGTYGFRGVGRFCSRLKKT